REGLRAGFAFPVQGSAGLLGVMEFFARRFHHPDPNLLRLVSIIGNQVGQFLERQAAQQTLHALLSEKTEAHRQIEEQYRFLIEETKDYAIIILDSEGRVSSWNSGAER